MATPTVIAVSGKQRSGKDFFARHLLDLAPSFHRRGLADNLKVSWLRVNDPVEYLAAMKEGEEGVIRYVDSIKSASDVRRSLIDYGQEKRHSDDDYWTNQVLGYIWSNSAVRGFIVPDVRLVSEVGRLQRAEEEGDINLLLVRMEASEEVRRYRGGLSNSDDPSECELDSFDSWDYIVRNEGSECLSQHAASVLAMTGYLPSMQ